MPDYFIREGDEYKLVSEKLIPERDLMAFKVPAENKERQLTTQVSELQKNLDEMTVRATSAETAVETVKTELAPLKENQDKVSTLESELTTLKEKYAAADTQLLTTRRQAIVQKFGLKDDAAKKLESMTVDQLTSFEESASLLGVTSNNGNGNNNPNQNRSNFDRGNNGTGSGSGNESAHTLIKEGLSELTRVGGLGSST
jgi:predicted RNase H-like nuclease (RuvC/YqgF family)